MPKPPVDVGPAVGMAALVECPHCATRVLPLPDRQCPSCRRDLDAAPDRATIATPEVLHAGREQARNLSRWQLAGAEVEQRLIEGGLPPEVAHAVVRAIDREQAAVDRASGRRLVRAGSWSIAVGVIGGLFCLIFRDSIFTNRVEAPLLAIVMGLSLIAWGTTRSRRALG